MTHDPKKSHLKAEAFFESLWREGDPWNFETSSFERAKYERQISLLDGRRYAHALEIGCGAGVFTRLLPRVADQILGIDISETAIARARALTSGSGVDFRVANVMEYDLKAGGPWDLVILSETICYLGWLYSFFEVAWLAMQLFEATRNGGRLMMANTCGGVEEFLMQPPLIRTYRDLFVNVGYEVKTEEILQGIKNGVTIDVLITVFEKAGEKGAFAD
jgi:SAM-dependent methyltransferase